MHRLIKGESMQSKTRKIIWDILLVLTVVLGIATAIFAGMQNEVVLSDGSIGYEPGAKELACHVAFAISFTAWLVFSVRLKK